MKYNIEVTFTIEVDAKDKEHAETIGWDWWAKHPRDIDSLAFFMRVHPDSVTVLERDE
jgi:hypothetical protein